MNFQQTLSKYFLKVFLKQFALASFVIILILLITNAFDTMQKFKSVEVTGEQFLQLIIYKIPFLYNEISVLTGFIAMILFIRSISASNELVILLSSGIAFWRVLLIPILSTFVIGAIILFTINPIGTNGLRRYKGLESKLVNSSKQSFLISSSGIYFYESDVDYNKIIKSKSINLKNNEMYDVTLLFLDKSNNFIKRLDAKRATLDKGNLNIPKAVMITNDSEEIIENFKIKMIFTIKDILNSLKSPEMIHIWHLKNDIEKFSKSGMSVINYQLYYYKQIFKPFSMVAMVLIACWFVSVNIRDNSGAKMMVIGLLCGLLVYFLLEVVFRILAYNGVAPMLATMLPILFIIVISNFVILHFQEA